MFCQLILRPLPPPSPYLWIPVSPTPNLTTAQSAEVRVWAAQKFDSDLGFIWGDFFLRDLWGLWALRRHFYLQIKGDWGLAIWSGGPAKVDQFSFSSLDPTNKFTVLFCFVLSLGVLAVQVCHCWCWWWLCYLWLLWWGLVMVCYDDFNGFQCRSRMNSFLCTTE